MIKSDKNIFRIGMILISFAGVIFIWLCFCCKNMNINQMYGCIIIFLVMMMISMVFGDWRIRRCYRKIDDSEELLADVIEKYYRADEADWDRWKENCIYNKDDASIIRLNERIFETAKILCQQQSGNLNEKNYLKELMSDMSHQMKTPLAALQVFIDIFEKEMSGSVERARELSNEAQKQIERLKWLITGMLKLAQLESRSLAFEKKELSIVSTIEKCIDVLCVKIREKSLNITIEKKGEDNCSWVLLHDEEWLQEAYINILKNAIEYAPFGSEIKIIFEHTALGYNISIIDYGMGIREEELPLIFNRFYRSEYTKHRTDGVGIGLALAKQIVEAFGGTITVFSRVGNDSYTKFVTTYLTKL